MDPTPALCALLLWTWRPVASRMPSFTVTERCEKEAMRSSFQPVLRGKGQMSWKSWTIMLEGLGGVFLLFSWVKKNFVRYFEPFSQPLSTMCKNISHISHQQRSVFCRTHWHIYRYIFLDLARHSAMVLQLYYTVCIRACNLPIPARRRMTWSSRGSSEKWGILLAHSTRVKSCLSAAWQILVTGSLVCKREKNKYIN